MDNIEHIEDDEWKELINARRWIVCWVAIKRFLREHGRPATTATICENVKHKHSTIKSSLFHNRGKHFYKINEFWWILP